jgi:SAM-dependent methyltransferase
VTDVPPQGREEHVSEITRISDAYRLRRDHLGTTPYRFGNPGYAFYMQLLEWSLLDGLQRSGCDIEGARVLDIGCGSGYFLHRLIEFGASEGSGVDLMPDRLESARARYPNLRFVQGNAAQLPFETEAFDLVTQFTCLSSVLDLHLRTAMAAEMWRVLRPGGLILSYDMRPEPWPLRVKRWSLARVHRSRTSNDAQTATTPISSDELRRLFPSAHLESWSAGLDFELCAIAGWSCAAARLLACIPALRAHTMAILIKPDESPATAAR